MKQVAVIIPFYKDHLTDAEQISLLQGVKILGNYPIIAIKPNSLDLSFLNGQVSFTTIISFDNTYFKDIYGYNRLMLAKNFYQAFLDYEYILIYQLDAFVFSDQLNYWCTQQYDYIGAPWLYPFKGAISDAISTLKSYFYRRYDSKSKGNPRKKQFYNAVGNGGFSLRKVQRFYDLSIQFNGMANDYIARNKKEFNEDVFWSIAINRKKKWMKIPGYKTALKFAVETQPKMALQLNQDKLPFGCHAWDKETDFWREEFKTRGYTI